MSLYDPKDDEELDRKIQSIEDDQRKARALLSSLDVDPNYIALKSHPSVIFRSMSEMMRIDAEFTIRILDVSKLGMKLSQLQRQRMHQMSNMMDAIREVVEGKTDGF